MSWGGVLSLILILIVCVVITGCTGPRPDGWCALSYNGACLSRWENGHKVGSGSIDMRYDGHSCRNGSAVDPEKSTPENVVLSAAQWCGGSTTSTVTEWR